MKTRMMSVWATALAAALGVAAQDPTPTTITYQGLLTAGNKPANGVYDLDFHLWTGASDGSDIASSFAGGTTVSNGVFTATLDFGAGNADFPAFETAPRWVEIRMRPAAQPNGPFSVLQPRQPVTSAPKAFYAYNAGQATFAQRAQSADSFAGPIGDFQIAATIPRLGNSQSFSGNNTFAGILLASNPANTFAGNGSGLVGLNASAVTAGTVDDARLSPNVALLGANQAFAGLNVFKTKLGIGLAPVDGVLAVGGDIHLSDSNLYLRGGQDRASGLGWYGGKNKPFGNDNPNGPVLFGAAGGILGTTGLGANAVLSWNAAGRVGINTTTPDATLGVEDFDATLHLKNRNDALGGFVGDTYAALQLGLYNPTTADFGQVPAGTSRTFLAMSFDGRVGSTVNGFIGDPVYRNLLDDGTGQLAVDGVVRTRVAGSTLSFNTASAGSDFAPALRLYPSPDPTGPNVNVVAGSPANSIASDVFGSSVLGGGSTKYPNTIGANTATIAGGFGNTVDASADGAAVGGGSRNHVVAGALYATVSGGIGNLVDKAGDYAMVPGGINNVASGTAALAAGYNARALSDGAFVWADTYVQNKVHPPFVSSTANEFAARATGGIRFESGYFFDIKANVYVPTGVFVAPGSGTWSQISDRNAKTNFAAVQPRAILDKVAALPIQEWNYKAEAAPARHVGPVAQDFRAAFGLGHGETTIDTVDADGIALAAIQGLNQKVEEQAAEIRELKALVAKLARRMEPAGGQ